MAITYKTLRVMATERRLVRERAEHFCLAMRTPAFRIHFVFWFLRRSFSFLLLPSIIFFFGFVFGSVFAAHWISGDFVVIERVHHGN